MMIRIINNYLKKKQLKKCGDNLILYGNPTIYKGNTISIGDNVKINDGCKLLGREGSSIIIGDRVTLSANVTILSSGYDLEVWIKAKKRVHKPMNTYIGDDVWICANSTIVGDVKITGKFVVIAAGSVVVSNITEDYCLYAGVPATLVKRFKY